jgi:hypothetical protein
MARDNSSKERQKRQLERKQNQRASYDRILIVTEGKKRNPIILLRFVAFIDYIQQMWKLNLAS